MTVWFPGRVRVLGSDFAEEAGHSNEGKGPRLSCSPGSRGLPRSLQNSAEMEFSDGQVWAAVQSPLGSCPFCFFKSHRPLSMESPPGLCSKSQLGTCLLVGDPWKPDDVLTASPSWGRSGPRTQPLSISSGWEAAQSRPEQHGSGVGSVVETGEGLSEYSGQTAPFSTQTVCYTSFLEEHVFLSII